MSNYIVRRMRNPENGLGPLLYEILLEGRLNRLAVVVPGSCAAMEAISEKICAKDPEPKAQVMFDKDLLDTILGGLLNRFKGHVPGMQRLAAPTHAAQVFADKMDTLASDLGLSVVDKNGDRYDCSIMVPAGEGKSKFARPGDWIVRYPDGGMDVVDHQSFARLCRLMDEE